MPYSIMLDAGHGGRDPGAVYNGRQEKDDALALTLAIGELLQERGAKLVGLTAIEGYTYESSRAEIDGKFLGLVLDQ